MKFTFLSLRGIAPLLLAVVLVGCSNVSKIPSSRLVTAPEPGKALVYLIRQPLTSGHGGTAVGEIDAPLFVDDQYVGSLLAAMHVALQLPPGKHEFMGLRRDVSVGDRPDFVIADLLAGKTYHIRVDVASLASPRIELEADNGQYRADEVNRLVRATTQVVVNERGRRWGERNTARAQQLRQRYLPVMEARVAQDRRLAERYVLRPESGR